MGDDVEALTLMAEEISLLRDLSTQGKSDPSWILVRACADHMSEIMDHFAGTQWHLSGEMPWWRTFQKKP
ncbi:hypothetical protein [Sphingobium yanoikuyae]|jgi:hypothetical protein|uniref:hypothetical protein n=1 Tax=Sphingobium yanoikuyae TaxID=13690 RepID=UPI00137688A7|nr:hypothetical protein [Sphingobium yanoikuyae]NBB39640.1 hypothetical protein [Sphingobium yanoikuyae]HEV7435125.1 hypothetical protein [Pseudorhizobium sp.]